MFSIARKNLWHDKIRFIVTLIGVTFAVVLVFAQLGVYFGFMDNVAILPLNTDADIWVTNRNIRNIDFALPIPERKFNEVAGTKGILWAEKVLLVHTIMKFPDGSMELIEIVGFDPVSGRAGPWLMKEGKAKDLCQRQTIIMDESVVERFGLNIGDKFEIMDSKVELVGVCKNTPSFSGAPFVFSSYDTAQAVFSWYRGKTTFVLAKLKPNQDLVTVVKRLSKIKHVDVYSKEGIIRCTKLYWTLNMGTGIAFLLMALMAVVIGATIVSQTIYSSTVEHLREFGTLKAIGATNWDICKIIFEQALINACGGYAFGIVFVLIASKFSKLAGITMVITLPMAIVIFFLTLIMCLSASFISIRKVIKLDPVMVFRA